MKTKIRYGMLGGGLEGNIGQAHREALAFCGETQLVAACFSRNFEKNMTLAHILNIEESRCYENYQQMARSESNRPDGIQFVVVTTPNNTHYEICKMFLNARIHVVCEKPLTTTLEQAIELETLAKNMGLLLMVTYTYTGHHMFRKAKDLLEEETIGKIRKVVVEYPQSWLAHEGDYGGKQGLWRCDPNQAGRVNCLGDIGTHIENAVATMTNLKIKKILAKMSIVVPGRILDDDDVILLEYTNGASGIYWAAQHALGYDNELSLRIFGSKGSLFWGLKAPTQLQLVNNEGITKTICADKNDKEMVLKYGLVSRSGTTGWKEAMTNLYVRFIKCIHAKSTGHFVNDMVTFPTAEDGVRSLRFINSCLESNRANNRWVEL